VRNHALMYMYRLRDCRTQNSHTRNTLVIACWLRCGRLMAYRIFPFYLQ